MKELEISHVSDTAFWIAYVRSVETKRPNALLCDPLAEVLAGERGKAIAQGMPHGAMTEWIVVLRTRIIDEYIAQAVEDGFDAILNLGAGLDTRPYRMTALPPDLKWIEVDHGEIIEYKDRVLANERPVVQLSRVSLDLADRSERLRLFSSISQSHKKVFVLTEGVVPYLENEEVASLAHDIRQFENMPQWLLEYFSDEARKYREKSAMKDKLVNSPFRFSPDHWFEFFEREGWTEKSTRYFWGEGEKVGRPMPLPFPMKAMAAIGSLVANEEKKKAMTKHLGYTLLEQA